jgi:hypothetical protein
LEILDPIKDTEKAGAGYKLGKFSIPRKTCRDTQTAKGESSSNSVRLNVMQSSRLQKHQNKVAAQTYQD